MPSTHIPLDRANCVPLQRLLRVGRSRPARGCDGLNPEEVGMKSRKHIEALLGTPVFLDLHVKVAKDWQRDPKQLRRLGF